MGDRDVEVPLLLEQMGRRGILGGAAIGALMLAACRGSGGGDQAGAAKGGSYPFGKPIKAAFVNAGLANSWPAQGKATTEQWSKWLGVDVTWYDGGLSIDKQRKAVDDMATKSWDFVAIQAFGIDTLVDPGSTVSFSVWVPSHCGSGGGGGGRQP